MNVTKTNEPQLQDPLVSGSYIIGRPIYDATLFDQNFKENKLDYFNEFKKEMKASMKRSCTTNGFIKLLCSNLPIIMTIKNYKKSYVLWDFVAGLTMCIFHIPQGLAYGLLAGLLPVNGLYTSLFPVLIYIVLASSNYLSIGTFALLSLIIREPVERLSADFVPSNSSISLNSTISPPDLDSFQHYRLLIAISVTFLAGLIQLMLGVFHLGFIVNYLSDAMISGFTTGASFQVATSQFPNILGYSVPKYSGIKKLFLTYYDLFRKLGETNVATLIVSVICIATLILIKEFINPRVKKKIHLPIPAELLVLVIGTLVSFLVSFKSRYGIEIVGEIPRGLPSPLLPDPQIFPLVVSDAFSLAIVSFSIGAALAKIFASRSNQIVDFNQELKAHGLANIFVSFFQGFFSGAALARTSTVVEVGMKTQLASVVSCACMFLVLLVIGPLFETVPKCLLSAIIIVALKGMFMQIYDLPKLWKISIFDFLTWIVACLATILLDVTLGLVTGFVFSIITVFIRSQIPKHGLLGRIPNTDLYKDPRIYPKAEVISGVRIFRFEAPLYFANCEQFRTSLYKMIDDSQKEISLTDQKPSANSQQSLNDKKIPDISVSVIKVDGVMTTAFNRIHDMSNASTSNDPNMEEESHPLTQDLPAPVKSSVVKLDGTLHHIIIDCSSIPYIDSTGIKILKEILQTFKTKNIEVLLAQCNDQMRVLFDKTDLHKIYNKEVIFLTVHDAVLYANPSL